MSELHEGDRVEVLGPLGKGFDPGDPERRKSWSAAASAWCPSSCWPRSSSSTSKVRLLMGGRTRDDILAVTEFERLGVETYVSTDDGSLGEEGLVTQVLVRKLAKYPRAAVYACGPMPMIEAVQQDLRRARACRCRCRWKRSWPAGSAPAWDAWSRGPAIPTTDPRYLCTCKEGPVFRAEQLDWSKLGEEPGYCEGCKS